ncbi:MULTISPECIES: sirohydrochlorin chelatase [unclassified Nocardioides]|uniref:sirohydrochlorin chelatase n=1 Tax=unclassified Nocardioides TaxID=2615069 RepID=UPI0006F482DE|nr:MULTISPECIES: sirohydrochlorin chelatase [unclassified Nocardioides]KQY64175.1 cobalamin biosynthesis protein CbiX [Nocardioides sp. Root140]KQZ70096.1 cobalamin biosynthesis protein CbiX [Nocardioides sp. Root151]KRF16193.1 cobalamin biosynthesis protein CbiX [Nocardioides sp. Soil796]
MTAPALIALAHGSRDPRSAETITALVNEVRAMRPDLRIETAFLELAKPSFATAVNKLVRAGYDEIVVVPLLLSDAFHAKVDVPSAVAEQVARHEGLQIRATEILGLETAFLEILDIRLREALKVARVRELDALVLAAAGSSDPLANQAVGRLARLWGTHHKLPVKAAFASATPPATGEAVRAFRAEGRRHIAVASFFLAPGFLPDRAAELAIEAGAVAVSDPLGAHPTLARTILARYAVGAVELVPV